MKDKDFGRQEIFSSVGLRLKLISSGWRNTVRGRGALVKEGNMIHKPCHLRVGKTKHLTDGLS